MTESLHAVVLGKGRTAIEVIWRCENAKLALALALHLVLAWRAGMGGELLDAVGLIWKWLLLQRSRRRSVELRREAVLLAILHAAKLLRVEVVRECFIWVEGLQTRVKVSGIASFMLPRPSHIGVARVFKVLRGWCKGSLRQASGRRRVHPLSKLLFKRRVVSHARALPSGCRQCVREAALLKGIRVHLPAALSVKQCEENVWGL